MRELNVSETEMVGGGRQISGYQGAGAIMGVLALGVALGPVGAPVVGIALGAAGGLAIAQFLAEAGV